MKLLKNKIKLSVSLVALVASQAMAADSTVWLARLTGTPSCSEVKVHSLGMSVNELEQQNIPVSEAKVARLRDRMFCMSCNCPDGTFNIVKVKSNEQLEEAMKDGRWEQIKPADIINSSETPDVTQHILPVTPEK